MAPIVWFSKRQQTVESSVFGAEFVAMKNGIETCRGLRYKLRMMGVTLNGPTFIYGDNMSAVHNVKLLPLQQPPVRARMDARMNPSAQRATQLRSVLARVYAVSIQNQITTTVP
jgi:hypothetical protein